MSITPEQVANAAAVWGLELLPGADAQLASYGSLLLRWNERLSLTAIRNPDELIERHLMEGVFAALHHPSIESGAPVLDFGSGTGIPGVPIAICRPELTVTLAESQRKKAMFLQEVARQLRVRLTVYAGRAEDLRSGSFSSVWMRAVDKVNRALPIATDLVSVGGSLCLLGSLSPPPFQGWTWTSIDLPRSERRVLHIGTRKPVPRGTL